MRFKKNKITQEVRGILGKYFDGTEKEFREATEKIVNLIQLEHVKKIELKVLAMLPSDEELKKHAEHLTDFWHRNGEDMSAEREYFCMEGDWVRNYFRGQK